MIARSVSGRNLRDDAKVLGVWEDGGIRHSNRKARSRSSTGRKWKVWLWT